MKFEHIVREQFESCGRALMRLAFNRVAAETASRSPLVRRAIKRIIRITFSFTGLAALCAVAGGVAMAARDGAITGRVIITKALTKKRVTLPSYQLRGVTLAAPPLTKPVSGGTGVDELSRVVVYLDGSGLNPGVPAKAVLSQKNRRFDPEMVVVTVGSTVSFPNLDVIFHNVFSLSKAKQFDLGFFPAGETRTVKFDRPGIVEVFCHIHPDMSAAILVLPTGSWTRPIDDGSFSLSGIPPGAYELVAWHRSAGFFRRHITVTSGVTPAVDFVIPVKELELGAGATGQSER